MGSETNRETHPLRSEQQLLAGRDSVLGRHHGSRCCLRFPPRGCRPASCDYVRDESRDMEGTVMVVAVFLLLIPTLFFPDFRELSASTILRLLESRKWLEVERWCLDPSLSEPSPSLI